MLKFIALGLCSLMLWGCKASGMNTQHLATRAEMDAVVLEIRDLEKHIKNVGAAIEQASEYCQKRGVPYGAVCNGHQMIAFIGSRNDGLSPIEGKALVFDSFEMIEKNFLVFWQCMRL